MFSHFREPKTDLDASKYPPEELIVMRFLPLKRAFSRPVCLHPFLSNSQKNSRDTKNACARRTIDLYFPPASHHSIQPSEKYQSATALQERDQGAKFFPKFLQMRI